MTATNIFFVYLGYKNSRETRKVQEATFNQNTKRDISEQASKIYVHTIFQNVSDSEGNFMRKQDNPKLPHMYTPVLIGNSSDQPIYKVFIISTNTRCDWNNLNNYGTTFEYPNFDYIYIPIFVKGNIYKIINSQGPNMGGVRPASIIYFTDSRGYKWLRDPQGNLVKLDDGLDLAKHFGICAPYDGDNSKDYLNLDSLYKDYPKHIY